MNCKYGQVKNDSKKSKLIANKEPLGFFRSDPVFDYYFNQKTPLIPSWEKRSWLSKCWVKN